MSVISDYLRLRSIVDSHDEILLRKSEGAKLSPQMEGFLTKYEPTIETLREYLSKAEGDVPEEFQFLLDKNFQAQLGEIDGDQEKVQFAAQSLAEMISDQQGPDAAKQLVNKKLVGQLADAMQDMGLITGSGDKGEGEEEEGGKKAKGNVDEAEDPDSYPQDGSAQGLQGGQQPQGGAEPSPGEQQPGTGPQGAPGLFDEAAAQGQVPPSAAVAAQGQSAAGGADSETQRALGILIGAIKASLRG